MSQPLFDNEVSLREAQTKMPLERLIREFGFGPQNEDWKSFDCPFCKKKDKAGIFTLPGGDKKLLKCMSTSCEANKAMSAVTFIMRIGGLSSAREAFKEYLKMAGVWVEKSPAAPMDKPRERETTFNHGSSALQEFYANLILSPNDEQRLFEKRGLTAVTCAALGFKSNPKSNRNLLLDLKNRFLRQELNASGLWLPAEGDKGERPNSQFCGFVQLAKKPGHLRKNRDDKTVWGWCDEGWCLKCERVGAVAGKKCVVCQSESRTADAILIPYFNQNGELIALRPHKGGAPQGTAASAMHLYVPRSAGSSQEEQFRLVVLTEGDFKAAALWQSIGLGRLLHSTSASEPVGVAAIPGISMAKHFQIREELEEWLRSVGCRHVIVAYDYENKENHATSITSQPGQSKQFDSQVWARYLAGRLAKKLHIRSEVYVLPQRWQDDNGKVDWDGALAKLIHGAQPDK